MAVPSILYSEATQSHYDSEVENTFNKEALFKMPKSLRC